MLHGVPGRAQRVCLLRLLRTVLVAAMVLNLAGLAHAFEEVVEDIVHVTTQGHSAHAQEHPEGQPGTDDTEHDCYGAVHHCGCCSSVPASLALPLGLRAAALVGGDAMPDEERVDAAGVRRRVDRPPTA